VLNVYRRHQPPCRFTTRRHRNCNCPIWVQGSLRGEYIRRGLNLRSWSAATDLVRDWEAAGEIGVVKRPEVPTIAEAVERFLVDTKAQKLSGETVRKYENLLNRRFLPWCEEKGLRYFKQIGVEEMRQFRATWTDSPNYATKNLERLRSFFRFCQQDDWIAKNPARAVKAPRVREKPTLPFSAAEMQRILDACDQYRGDQDRLRAFVLVMRHSGLRIGDTIALGGAPEGQQIAAVHRQDRDACLCATPASRRESTCETRNKWQRPLLLHGKREGSDGPWELVAVSGVPVSSREDRRRAFAPLPRHVCRGVARCRCAFGHGIDSPWPFLRKNHRTALQAVGAIAATKA
jgi:hypothetical protein